MKRLVIFGASGNLAKTKLIPALSKIDTSDVEIIAYARSNLKDSYSEKLKKDYSYEDSFLNKIKYIQGDYYDLTSLIEHMLIRIQFIISLHHLRWDLLVEFAHLDFDIVGIEKPFGEDY